MVPAASSLKLSNLKGVLETVAAKEGMNGDIRWITGGRAGKDELDRMLKAVSAVFCEANKLQHKDVVLSFAKAWHDPNMSITKGGKAWLSIVTDHDACEHELYIARGSTFTEDVFAKNSALPSLVYLVSWEGSLLPQVQRFGKKA